MGEVAVLASGVLGGWDGVLAAWMEDPRGRLALALIFLAVTLAALLLILVPLMRRPIRLTLQRLTRSIDRITDAGGEGGLPADLTEEAGALAESVGRLIERFQLQRAEAERQRNDLRALMDAPEEPGWLSTDAEGRLQYCSAGAERLLGYRSDEIQGRSVEFLFPEEEWNRLVPKLARRSMREAGLTERVRLLRKDRSLFPAILSVRASAGTEASRGFVCRIQDASSALALEARVRDAEARLRQLSDSLPDGVIVLQEGRVVDLNPAAAGMLGKSARELSGRSFKEFLHPADLLLTLDRLARLAGGAGPEEWGLRVQGPGEARTRQVKALFFRIEHRGAPALLGILRDESSRQRTEQEVRDSRALLDATLDATSDGILVLESRAGRRHALLVNRRLEELLGVSGETILGWGEEGLFRELAERSRNPEETREAASALSEAPAGSLVVELAGSDGRVIELTAGNLTLPSGDGSGRIVSFQDITERRRSERTLRESHQALQASQGELQAMVGELQAAREDLAGRNEQLERLNRDLRSVDEMKSKLLANVSHELQTPLVLIKGYTEMILKKKIGPLTPEQEKGLGVALKNIDRLVEMIDNLLDVSRLDRGEASLQLEEFPLWQLIDEVVELVREKIQRKGLSLTTAYETEDLTVKADRAKIAQVFINLLSNAIKFNREGGRIVVRVGRGPRGMFAVDVQDTGIGIPEAERERIFERFYQVDASPGRRYEGTGIGLSIVREILALHGCTIQVHSREGEGTTFTFTLPQGRSAAGSRSGGERPRLVERSEDPTREHR